MDQSAQGKCVSPQTEQLSNSAGQNQCQGSTSRNHHLAGRGVRWSQLPHMAGAGAHMNLTLKLPLCLTVRPPGLTLGSALSILSNPNSHQHSPTPHSCM